MYIYLYIYICIYIYICVYIFVYTYAYGRVGVAMKFDGSGCTMTFGSGANAGYDPLRCGLVRPRCVVSSDARFRRDWRGSCIYLEGISLFICWESFRNRRLFAFHIVICKESFHVPMGSAYIQLSSRPSVAWSGVASVAKPAGQPLGRPSEGGSRANMWSVRGVVCGVWGVG